MGFSIANGTGFFEIGQQFIAQGAVQRGVVFAAFPYIEMVACCNHKRKEMKNYVGRGNSPYIN
eukprot:894143-Pelagomonas_calceolata.AAC.1